MKKLLLSGLFSLLFILAVQAQKYSPEVTTLGDALVQQYALDNDQIDEVYVIAFRKVRNLSEIEVLRESDYEQYLMKRRSIRLSTERSIERILKNDRQREALDATRLAQRVKESEIIRKIKAEGGSKVDIQRAILEAEDQ